MIMLTADMHASECDADHVFLSNDVTDVEHSMFAGTAAIWPLR